MELQKAKLNEFGYNIIEIETKGNCNMACTFCPYPVKEDKKSELSESAVYRLIDQIDPNQKGFEYLLFNQYNEPLLDPRIFSFIKYAENKGIKVKLTTNGLLLGQEAIRKKLLETGLTYIKISVQTIDPKKFSKARGIKMTLEQYCKGLFSFLKEAHGSKTHIDLDIGCNLISLKRYVYNKIVGLSTGDKAVPRTIRQLEVQIFDFIQNLSKFDPRFKFEKENVKKILRTAGAVYVENEGIKLADNIYIKIKPFIYGYMLRDFKKTKTPFGCDKKILGVLADGNVVPCCMMYEPEIKLGNANTQTLNEVLESNTGFFENLRSVNLNKEDVCLRCYGEQTERGVLYRKYLPYLKKIFKKL